MTKSASTKSTPAAATTTVPTFSEKPKTRVAPLKTQGSTRAVAASKAATPAKPKKPAAAKSAADRKTKLALVIEMLRAKRGASADEIAKATGWQRHTVRGAIAGAIKRKLGLKVTTEDRDGVRIYRIAGR